MNDESLLARYHARPGRTVSVFEHWRDSAGRSSYQVLAHRVEHEPRSATVLDLACGDGYFLDLLRRRGFERLIGVDRSPQELAAARDRLGPGIDLWCQDARSLSLPDRTVDVLTCHMALMLMAPVESALSQAARILVPGAPLLAIINRGLYDPVYEVYRQQRHRVTAEFGMDRLALGDRRVFTVDGLRQLIIAHPGFHDCIYIHDFEVECVTAPEKLWDMLSLDYDVYRLPEPAQSLLRERLMREWRAFTDECGEISVRMGMRLLECRTRSDARVAKTREPS